MIGKTILHYKIIEKLGEGGMGVVYKAEDTKLKRDVAIKFLPRQIAASDDERARFKIEAQAAAALNHPNIATIYAIEEMDDEMFIVMEYIEGQELKQIVGAQHAVPLPDVLNYATQIASGLQAAHEKDVTHRDIKSANIMITDKGQVKIMDFGLAKVRGGAQVTKLGTTLGTAAYMSPEQAQGLETDHRTDIWAFGAVLYEMLTGKLPFGGDYEQAVTYAILNEEPEPVSVSRSETPEALQQVVDKSLLKSPQQRYQNIDEMLTNLEEVRNRLDIGKTRPSLQTKTSKRRRVLVYGGLAALVGLVTLIGISFFSKGSESIDSIAVLPLQNLSGETDQDIFTAGMHEALITELSKISALRTISRTSVMRYKKTEASITEIAEALSVDAVVEGSVFRSGETVRITVQLIATDPERNLWAQTFDRDLVDVLALHSEVARQIVDEIQIQLTQAEATRLKSVGAVNSKAYETYLLGRHYYGLIGEKNLGQAVEFFERTIEIDSTFALGYAGLALTYARLGGHINVISPQESWPKVKKSAEKALSLDADLAEAYTSLAFVKSGYEWDWGGAKEDYLRAIELNPNNIEVLEPYAWFLERMSYHDESAQIWEKISQLNPHSKRAPIHALRLAGRKNEAIQLLQHAIESVPENFVWYWMLALIYTENGRYDEAIEQLLIQIPLMEGENVNDEVALLGHLYGRVGRNGDALRMLQQLDELSAQGKYISPALKAWVYVGLNDTDNAILWLTKGYETHAHRMGNQIPLFSYIFDPIRDNPKFMRLLRKMNLEGW